MDIRQLEYFVRIAELGSFTRASIDLGMTQPALSRQIRQLETELRQNLLTRNGRGVVVTEAGNVLLAHARLIIHQIQRAREDVGRVRGALVGHVAVGLPPGIAKVLTVALTHAFRERLPQATLSIAEGLSVSLHDQLLAGHLDVALLYNPTWSPSTFTPLGSSVFTLLTALSAAASTVTTPLSQYACEERRITRATRPQVIVCESLIGVVLL